MLPPHGAWLTEARVRSEGQNKRRATIGRPRDEMADHIHKDAADRYAPCLQALLLLARPIINIGDFYYCVVLTILNVIPNGITCIYKILEIN